MILLPIWLPWFIPAICVLLAPDPTARDVLEHLERGSDGLTAKLEAPPPAHESHDLRERSEAYRQHLLADAELAKALHAQILEHERLNAARARLPWWRRLFS